MLAWLLSEQIKLLIRAVMLLRAECVIRVSLEVCFEFTNTVLSTGHSKDGQY